MLPYIKGISFFLLIITLRYSHAYNPTVLIQEFKQHSKVLSLVSIFQNQDNIHPILDTTSVASGFGYSLLDYLNNWIIEAYISRGLIRRGDAIHLSLMNEERMNDERSTVVFICEKNDLSKIRALIRISQRGVNSVLYSLPLQLRKAAESPTIPERSGEIKNFFHSPELGEDYMPLLFWRLYSAGIFDRSFQNRSFNGQLFMGNAQQFSIETYKKAANLFMRFLGFKNQSKDDGDAFGIYLHSSLKNINEQLIRKQAIPSIDVKGTRHFVPNESQSPELISFNPVPVAPGLLSPTCSKPLGLEAIRFYNRID